MTKKVELTSELRTWFESMSGQAANDMFEGGDDWECVAESCFTVLDCEPKMKAAFNELTAGMNYREKLNLVKPHIYTL